MRARYAAFSLFLLMAASALLVGWTQESEPVTFRSPQELAWAPDGSLLAVSDRTAGCLVLIDPATKKVLREVSLKGSPEDVAWASDGRMVYVAEYDAGTVAEIDPAAGKVLRRLAVGPKPRGLALCEGRLLVTEAGLHDLRVLDLKSGETRSRIPVVRRPFAVAVSPDGKTALVSNLLPGGPSSDPAVSGSVSLVDPSGADKPVHLKLPTGSSSVRDTLITPDGKWGIVAHTLGRVHLPTTQLDRGWVNTNAITFVDLATRSIHATILLDHPMRGSADPWGLALVENRLYVTIAGTHELMSIDLSGTVGLFKENRESLVNDLASLTRTGLGRRIQLPGKGPRGVSASPAGGQLAVAMHFEGTVALVDATGENAVSIPVGVQPAATPQRRGESHFHDATMAFQNWLSCASCHPEGRSDALNWDLLNDGMGNPKNAKSMMWSDRTPPVTALGIRADMPTAVAAGFRHIQFVQVPDEVLRDVEAYLRSLEPEPSPWLDADGGLSESALRGKKLFESAETGCVSCHPAPLYTDLKMHDVGTRGEYDRKDRFDTPTLVELWRSGPFLHDGSAGTLEDVLRSCNKQDRHGRTSKLKEEQIRDLVAFLKSL